MPEAAGPLLDVEIARKVFGEEPRRALPYSTDNSAADLVLWRLSQDGVAFRVQELEGRHHCVLWSSSGPALTTASSPDRPLAICRAALEHAARAPRFAAKRPRP